jgi:hypothetical protein
MGSIVAKMHNVNRGRGSPVLQAKDFMLPKPETKKQKEARLKAALRGVGKGKKGTR